jgi:asparagine synthase (glutamine-hydrolysing)
MCGIARFDLSNGVADSSALLRSMAQVIAHRGPDDEVFFEMCTGSGKYDIGLAHRRLSIIDLDNRNQPIGNEYGSIQIVFNAEICNFQGLRNELIARGHSFQAASDTEAIIHAYEEYDDNYVEYFRDMLALVLWVANGERLFLARDRFGKKPPYLREECGGLLLGAEIK